MTRRKRLGNMGERWTEALLKGAGFTSVQDLNAIRHNHRGGDFLAKRNGNLYFISTKARNKFVQRARTLNSGYNVYPQKVRAAANEYGAIPSWLTIQVDTDRQCFTAYFGTIDSLDNPNAVAVPMSARAVSKYECLARDKFDADITCALSNQLVAEETANEFGAPATPERTSIFHVSSPNEVRHNPPMPRMKPPAPATFAFEDHVAYADPAMRPLLRELRNRILALNNRVLENITKEQRIAYSVSRIFAEVKIQKKRILIRVFDMGLADPRKIVTDIPRKKKWQHQKEIAINNIELLDYAMPFVEASYSSALTTSPPIYFGRR